MGEQEVVSHRLWLMGRSGVIFPPTAAKYRTRESALATATLAERRKNARRYVVKGFSEMTCVNAGHVDVLNDLVSAERKAMVSGRRGSG